MDTDPSLIVKLLVGASEAVTAIAGGSRSSASSIVTDDSRTLLPPRCVNELFEHKLLSYIRERSEITDE